MNAQEHYEAAEKLLRSCQTGTDIDGTEEYPVTIETTSVPVGVGPIEKITGIVRTERRSS